MIIKGKGIIRDDDDNPHSVLGHDITCVSCATIFVPETRDDIVRVTYKHDTVVDCPVCEQRMWAYYGTDERIHCGDAGDWSN